MSIIDDISQAWVELYDDKGFKDRRLTIRYLEHPAGVPDFKKIKSDDGKKGFGDKASAAKWQIPPGWQAVIHDDQNFKDSRLELVGTGRVHEMADFGSFSDKGSSMRWERVPN